MKILVVTSRIPYPLEKGDKLRIFNQIKFLQKKHEVILCAVSVGTPNQEAISEVAKHVSQLIILKIPYWKMLFSLFLNFFKSKPFQIAYFYSTSGKNKINEIVKKNQPDLIYCHLIRVAEYVKDLPSPKVLDYMDAFSKGIERRIQKQSVFLKWLFKLENRRLVIYESDIFNYFDSHVIIAESDKKIIKHEKNSTIEIIPNGIDIEHFQSEQVIKKYDLLFSGNMSYPPNVEAAIFIVEKIMPLLITEFPQLTLMIAGANPTQNIKALASSNVMVSGWVDDLRKPYNEARIFIAPMQIGTGLQNKLLEAMAMKLPSITSKLANGSLLAKEGEEILIGNSAQEYANHVRSLLNDEQKSATLANKGHEFVITNYDWESSNQKLEELLLKLLSKN